MNKNRFNQLPKKAVRSMEANEMAVEITKKEKEHQDWLQWQRQVIKEETLAEAER